jgi:hypothetical protein
VSHGCCGGNEVADLPCAACIPRPTARFDWLESARKLSVKAYAKLGHFTVAGKAYAADGARHAGGVPGVERRRAPSRLNRDLRNNRHSQPRQICARRADRHLLIIRPTPRNRHKRFPSLAASVASIGMPNLIMRPMRNVLLGANFPLVQPPDAPCSVFQAAMVGVAVC